MKNKNLPHVWAELYVNRKSDKAGIWSWEIGKKLNLWDQNGRSLPEITNDAGWLTFGVKNQSDGPRSRGGHNWYMTTRFDVWASMPDGRRWHGVLITGGDNTSFRMFPTREVWVSPDLGSKHYPNGMRIAIRPHSSKYNARSKVIQLFDRKGRRLCVAKLFGRKIIYAKRANELPAAFIDSQTRAAFGENFTHKPFDSRAAA
jgi:hypothetical protein